MYSTIRVDVQNAPIGRITLDRPDKRNPIGAVTCGELVAAFSALKASPDIRVIVLTGAGTVFSAGGDLSAMQKTEGPTATLVELFTTMHELGKPVMLKRGISSTVKEWLMAAEYIVSRGNRNVILCERGIRTFETMTRNTLDLGVLPLLRAITHLPIVVDPSHGTGVAKAVTPLARAATATGVDGIMVEVHPNPAKALSDGPQALTFPMFEEMMRDVVRIVDVMGQTMA